MYENESSRSANQIGLVITNLSFSRYVNMLFKLTTEDDFLIGKEKSLILNIVQTAYNLVKTNRIDSRISDDLLNSLLRIADNVVRHNPQFLPSFYANRTGNYVRAFNSANIDSSIIDKLAFASLNNMSDARAEGSFHIEMILLLEKVCKGEKTEEKIKCIKRILGDRDKIKRNFENSGSNFTGVFKLYCIMNKFDDVNLISDKELNWAKDIMMSQLKSDNIPIHIKLNILYSLSNATSKFVTEEDISKITGDIRYIFKVKSL